MTGRDADAAALAGVFGWKFEIGPAWRPATDRVFWTRPRNSKGEAAEWIDIPTPSAPLGERMAFVGRLAEQLGCERPRVVYGPDGWIVNYSDETLGQGHDLVHAAIRAALNAKGAT